MPEAFRLNTAAVDSGPTMSPRVFEKIRDLVYQRAGIDLREGKENLVTARLTKKLRETGCRTYEEYLERVVNDPSGESLISLIDALTTNFTSFLREPAHFDFLRDQILTKIGSRDRVEVWCAAAATGEEPYSLAFTLLEALGMSALPRCRIVATDISTKALENARRGVYAAERFSGVPKEWLPKYLLKGDGDFTGYYRVKPEIARIIEFRRLNLIENFNHANSFPLISCRNVMIYFDKPTQEKVVNRMVSFLEPGGYLFVGHSEGLTGIDHGLRFVKAATYQKPGTLSAGRPKTT